MSTTRPNTHSITRLTTVLTTVMITAALTARASAGRAGRRLHDRLPDRITARLARLRAEPDAGYSSETVVVTSLLVGVAVVVFGTIFWDDITSFAKTIFNNITHD